MPGGIHPPLEVMATWPTPNYVDPQTRSKTVLIFACVLGPLSLGLLLVRLWVRVHLQRTAGWDDWLMLIAILPMIAVTIACPLATEANQFNRHIWDVEPQYYVVQRKLVLTIETVFCVASGLIKISILLFYRRLSSRVVSRTFQWATWISIYFIAAYSIAFTLVPIFICTPVSAFWDQNNIAKIAEGYTYKCLNEGADVLAAGVISSIQDLLTALLPTFLYWNLKIPLRQKVALFGIFATGYCVVAIGVLRAYASWRIFFSTYDVTWVAGENFLWTMLELHIGAMCANAPALKVFFKEFLKITSSARSRSRSRSKGSTPHNSGRNHSISTKNLSTLEKFSFWKHSRGQSRKGYLSEPHTNVSVDMHGGVQRDASPTPLKRGSLAITTQSFDILISDDIEMGHLEQASGSSDSESEVQALPPIPSQPPATAVTAKQARNSSQAMSAFPPGKSSQRDKWY